MQGNRWEVRSRCLVRACEPRAALRSALLGLGPPASANPQPARHAGCPHLGRRFRARNEMASLARLREIGEAMAKYQRANGCYPPQYVPDKDGRPMHSSRVLLLPYLGRDDLFKQYDMTEPWNSPRTAPSRPKFPVCTIRLTTARAGVRSRPTWPFRARKHFARSDSAEKSEIKDDPSKRIALIEAANFARPMDRTEGHSVLPSLAGNPRRRWLRNSELQARKIPVLLANGDPAWLPVGVRTDLFKRS